MDSISGFFSHHTIVRAKTNNNTLVDFWDRNYLFILHGQIQNLRKIIYILMGESFASRQTIVERIPTYRCEFLHLLDNEQASSYIGSHQMLKRFFCKYTIVCCLGKTCKFDCTRRATNNKCRQWIQPRLAVSVALRFICCGRNDPKKIYICMW